MWCSFCSILLSATHLSADAASLGPTHLLSLTRMAPWGNRRHSFLETREQDQGFAEPLRYKTRLFVASLEMGDGRGLDVLVDTGSGCGGHHRFRPDGDASGHFLSGDAADIHMSYVTGDLGGAGFEGRVCLAEACGTVRFIVATWASDDFASIKFDAILGLGPRRQSWADGLTSLMPLLSRVLCSLLLSPSTSAMVMEAQALHLESKVLHQKLLHYGLLAETPRVRTPRYPGTCSGCQQKATTVSGRSLWQASP